MCGGWPLLSFMCRIYWTLFCIHAMREFIYICIQYWFNIYALWAEIGWASEMLPHNALQTWYAVMTRSFHLSHSNLWKNNWYLEGKLIMFFFREWNGRFTSSAMELKPRGESLKLVFILNKMFSRRFSYQKLTLPPLSIVIAHTRLLLLANPIKGITMKTPVFIFHSIISFEER